MLWVYYYYYYYYYYCYYYYHYCYYYYYYYCPAERCCWQDHLPLQRAALLMCEH